ncbi:hypothetical protein MBLNU457_6354t1 [Dothideomycetes sp. NU457]
MLYYSGYTRRLGAVDEGSTVTDFLPAERARGITIQSAAITFNWPPGQVDSNSPPQANQLLSATPHNINLIDTPGHADFTFEVLRSLRILDGAVCILDGVAGVEAQTEQVWKQASHYHIPRILFVNKLDRDGAAFARTIREIGTRLNCWPAICQIPWWRSNDGKLQGVGDVTSLRGLLYEEGGDGKQAQMWALEDLEAQHPTFAKSLKEARIALIDVLSEHDDQLVESFLDSDGDHLAISQHDIMASLRRVTMITPQKVAPVFSGASFRNVGVQPLLDAVVNLLPSPDQRPDPEAKLGKDTTGLNMLLAGKFDIQAALKAAAPKGKTVSGKAAHGIKSLEACALAFKVVTDAKRGVLVYVRVYSGSINRGVMLYNTNLGVTEPAPRLLKMYANDAVEVNEIAAGQIGVITGLKHARTGDTLIVYTGANPRIGPPAPINSLQLRPIAVPPPVFFTSVEPNSLKEEKSLAEALSLLLREDPSLNVTQDPESGQTHLAGMGELHLEIARDRVIDDLKAKARIGAIQIGYREVVTGASELKEAVFDREVAGKASKAGSIARVAPLDEAQDIGHDPESSIELSDNNHLTILTTNLNGDGSSSDPEGPSLPPTLTMRNLRAAIQTGVSAALARGPSHSYAIHSTAVTVEFNPSNHLFSSTTPSAISSATRMAVQSALRASADATSGTVLMEPVMAVTITTSEDSLGDVVHDISSARGGSIVSLGGEDDASDAATEEEAPIDPKRIYAPPDPFASSGGQGLEGGGSVNGLRVIEARVPLKEMVGYLKHLRSITGGRGTFVMRVDRFERMSAVRMRNAISEMRGEYA